MMLASANLRAHWRSFLATLLATTFGVALMSAALIVYDSSRPVTQPRLESATLLVLPAQAHNEFGNVADFVPWSAEEAHRIAADLGALPGAEAVVTDRSFYAQPFIDGAPVADEGAQDAGHGWASAQLSPSRLTSGAVPTTPDQIVVPDSLGFTVGEIVSVNLAAGLEIFTVAGTHDGPGIFFTDDRATQLDPGVRAIGVVATDGAQIDDLVTRVEERLGDRARVAVGGDRAVLEPEFVSHRRNLGTQLIVAMATIALFTTVFVVGSTFALATSERRREIALLRTIGAATGQVRRMVLGEAAVIGVVGGLVGAVVGLAGAPLLRLLLLDLDVQPPGFELRVSAWPLLVSVAIGICVAVTGAWVPARSAATVAPIEALLNSAVERRPMSTLRWLTGLVSLVGGLAATVSTASAATDSRVNTAVAAVMLLILAAALLAPIVIGPIAGLVTMPFTRQSRSAASMLIEAELTTGSRRAAATAAPIIAAVGFAVLLSGMVQTMAVAYPAEQTDQLRGLVAVIPDGTAGLSDQVVADTGAGPAGTTAGLPTRVFVTGPDGNITVVDAVGSLDERYAAPGRAVLDEATADLLGKRSGEEMSVTFADGRSETVVVSQVLPLDPARGAFVLPRALVREHDPSALTEVVFLPEDMAPTLSTAGARVEDAHSFAVQDYLVDARLTNWLAVVLITMSVGSSGLAVANSMAMTAYRRRDDIAILKGTGGTERQLLSAAVGETSVVVLIGAALGVIVTVPPLLAMAAGLSKVTETDVGLQLSWTTLLGVVAGCWALATAATVVVTRRGLRERT